jgi:predicted ABC-type ATPase
LILMARPVLYVLAGVNGAGKSSIGGHLLARAGLAWYNPDTFARELIATTGCAQDDANAAAWHEGVRRLDQAISTGRSFAFETTLGGNSIAARIRAATASHDAIIWFCGLASPEQHIARVRARAAMGGHDIAEDKIRERFTTAPANLIALMPHLAHLRVYDNSVDVAPGDSVPDPTLLLEMVNGGLVWPTAPQDLRRTPEWAKALVEAAIEKE